LGPSQSSRSLPRRPGAAGDRIVILSVANRGEAVFSLDPFAATPSLRRTLFVFLFAASPSA